MKHIPVEYFFGGEVYRLNGNLFDLGSIQSMTDYLQKKYSPFAEKIIAEKGRLRINLSFAPYAVSTIRYEHYFVGISDKLVTEINSLGTLTAVIT